MWRGEKRVGWVNRRRVMADTGAKPGSDLARQIAFKLRHRARSKGAGGNPRYPNRARSARSK